MNPAFLPLLTLAVIEDLDEVRRMTDDQRRRAAAESVDPIAGGGDWLIRTERIRGGKMGREEFRQVWKAMVRAVAIASLQPGGAALFGQHFDATKWPFSAVDR
jgi:hypothetical protein